MTLNKAYQLGQGTLKLAEENDRNVPWDIAPLR